MELIDCQTPSNHTYSTKNVSQCSTESPFTIQLDIISQKSLQIQRKNSNIVTELQEKKYKNIMQTNALSLRKSQNQIFQIKKNGGSSQISIVQNQKSNITSPDFQHQMIKEEFQDKNTVLENIRVYDPLYLSQKPILYKYILRNARSRKMNRTSVILTMEYFDVLYTKTSFRKKNVVKNFIIFMVISSKMTDHVYFSLKGIAESSNLNYQQLLDLEQQMYQLLQYNFYKFTYVQTVTNIMKALNNHIDFFTQCLQSFTVYRKIFYILDEILLQTLDYNIAPQIIEGAFFQIIHQRYSEKQTIQKDLYQVVREQLHILNLKPAEKKENCQKISQLAKKFTLQKLQQVKADFTSRTGNYGDFISYYS